MDTHNNSIINIANNYFNNKIHILIVFVFCVISQIASLQADSLIGRDWARNLSLLTLVCVHSDTNGCFLSTVKLLKNVSA